MNLTGVGAFSRSLSDQDDFEPFILENGVAAGKASWLRVEEDDAGKTIRAGFFKVEPGEYPDGDAVDYEFTHDESFFVIQGEVKIELESGETYHFSAGDSASFRRNTKSVWTFTAPFAKFFIEN